ncbi:MAG: membrane protein [Caldibacillus debilis]|jgi:uncharacterized membrane-anchored protein YitT (DUF2179 family)|uniref:Putative BCR n=1 Tax=Caldibacillus debilis GB1 TaxID=1339248 RepID=A0A420VFB0_9BACI|nr:membrane protein [Bacillaceae bacterium]REJ28793.1 MAG: membrane protein [Caldibacillus debilis]RKO62309.1 putative BCR [Caldibacillus debilis GB1]
MGKGKRNDREKNVPEGSSGLIKASVSFFCLLLGAVLQGAAMALFLFPHSVPSGGAAGLAILIHHWFRLNHGISLWLVNAFFFLFALRHFGYMWTFRTIFSVALASFTISTLSGQMRLPHGPLPFDLFAGSVIFGAGVGLLIRAGASSGGMVIPALLIAERKNWSPGKVLFGINLFIYLLTSFVIDYKIVLYAILCQFLSSRIIDFVFRWDWAGLLPAFRRRRR